MKISVHRHFLADALGYFLARHDRRAAFRRGDAERFLQPLDDLLLMLRDQLRHERRDARDDRLHLRHIRQQHRRQLRAFARTHDDEFADRFLAAREHRFADRIGLDRKSVV